MTDLTSKRLSFWDDRSTLGFSAGSGDTNLKTLEINAILHAIGDANCVLDAGCGNGYTLASLASSIPDCSFYGFDYSNGMINSANELLNARGLADRVHVCVASLLDSLPESLATLSIPDCGFDCIYTERSLINLDSSQEQARAIQSLWELLSPGGRLIICEAFLDGLNEINFYREAVGLSCIQPPWHNRYFSLDEFNNLVLNPGASPTFIEFSGTYYFISRVIHAKEALHAGNEPSYEAPINTMSLDVPALPVCGQSKIVIFEKP